MKKILCALSFIVIAMLTSCARGNQLVEITSPTENKTTIEGNFTAPQVYRYQSPAILFPRSHDIWIKYGKVIDRDNDGVYVLEKKSGVFGSQDTLYYKYDEIRAIVDSTNFCVWGQLNDRERDRARYIFNLVNFDDPEYSPLYMELVPDTNFSYQIKPGRYVLTSITMDYPGNTTLQKYYMSTPYVIGEFNVEEGAANYLGDIKVLAEDDSRQATVAIPCMELQKGGVMPAYAAGGGLLGAVIAGVAAGLTTALTSSSNARGDSTGTFKFDIDFSKDYQGKGNRKVKEQIISPPHIDELPSVD